MKIGIDGRWMIGNYRGMGRFAHAFIRPVRENVLTLLPGNSGSTGTAAVTRGNSFFPYWEQVVLPRLCREHGVTHLVCPYNTAPLHLPPGIKLILVVHDLIFLESWRTLPPSSSVYQAGGRIYRRWIVPRVLKRAHRVVTVSEFTRQEISSRLALPKSAIEVIPNSVPDGWYVEAPLPAKARDLEILTVSGDAPSKNLDGLIRAFASFLEQLPAQVARPVLRVVGLKSHQQARYRRLAEQYRVAEAIMFESFVDDLRLRSLYRQASLFVLPSLFEGFGIPIAEAMASGTPVACSNTASLPEVLQDAGWQFDPRDRRSITAALLESWLDSKGREARAASALVKANRFRESVVGTRIAQFWGNA